MRTASVSSLFYTPGIPPSDAAEMRRFLFEELGKISAALATLSAGHLDKAYVAPSKPRDGDVRYADGTSWNPGGGSGIYYYNGTSWVKL